MKNYSFVIPFTLCFIFAMYMSYTDTAKPVVEKVGHGSASKITFEGHSYVVCQQNISDCIIHDPDCECRTKDKKGMRNE